MVTVSNHQQRKSAEGSSYLVLELTNQELEMIISQQTGRFYATVRKCYISATFPRIIRKTMVGKQLPGYITKVECDPYEFAIPETSEVITRSNRHECLPIEQTFMEQTVLAETSLLTLI